MAVLNDLSDQREPRRWKAAEAILKLSGLRETETQPIMPPFQFMLLRSTVGKSAIELTDRAAKSSAERSSGLSKAALLITVLSGAPAGIAEKKKLVTH